MPVLHADICQSLARLGEVHRAVLDGLNQGSTGLADIAALVEAMRSCANEVETWLHRMSRRPTLGAQRRATSPGDSHAA